MMTGFSLMEKMGVVQSERYATACVADNEETLRAQQNCPDSFDFHFTPSVSLSLSVSFLVAKVLSIIQSKRKVRSYAQANA